MRFLEAQEVRQLARGILEDLDAAEVLRRKGPRIVARCALSPTERVVVKLWTATELRSRVSKALRVASFDHEWRSLLHAKELGIPIPEPRGFARGILNGSSLGGAIVLEDLGECFQSIILLKELLEQKDDAGLERFDQAVIEMTVAMIKGNLLDEDHGILNIVSTPDRRLYRLDLERARKVLSLRLRQRLHGDMLGRLLATYTFGVQPNAERVAQFAARLKERVAPPAGAWARARMYVEQQLEQQERSKGYRMKVVIE